MQQVFIFIIFLGPLIFFHELGHFLFAKFFGVRVEVFSIGFGPKLLKFKKGDTEYALSLIPLGGYVKMFGDDASKSDSLQEEDKKHSFLHKSKWARFWIVFGGPFANFIFALFIYGTLALTGEKVPQLRFGQIESSGLLYETGVRSGDVLAEINGKRTYTLEDIEHSSDLIKSIKLIRLGNELELKNLSVTTESFLQDFTKGQFILRQPLVVDKLGNYFAISKSATVLDLESSMEEFQSGAESLFVIPVSSPEHGVAILKDRKVEEMKINSGETVLEALGKKSFHPLDLVVSSIVMGSAADKAGFKKGDIITALGEQPLYDFENLRKSLQVSKDKEVRLNVLREGKQIQINVKPELKDNNGVKVYSIGIWSSIQLIGPKLVKAPGVGIVESVNLAFERTWVGISKTLDGFKKLVTAQASVKSLGGPLAIGKVASDSINVSLSYFFRLMAIISINLGIINLFPVPVLDGGHIVFLAIEAINRGPISKRAMEMAQQVGVTILLLLIFVSLYNDISRFF